MGLAELRREIPVLRDAGPIRSVRVLPSWNSLPPLGSTSCYSFVAQRPTVASQLQERPLHYRIHRHQGAGDYHPYLPHHGNGRSSASASGNYTSSAAKKTTCANRNTLRAPVVHVNRFRVRLVREDTFVPTNTQPALCMSKARSCLKQVQQTATGGGTSIRTDASRYNDLSFNKGQQALCPSAAGSEENDILELAMIRSGIVGEEAHHLSPPHSTHSAPAMTDEQIANIERSVRLDHDYTKSFY